MYTKEAAPEWVASNQALAVYYACACKPTRQRAPACTRTRTSSFNGSDASVPALVVCTLQLDPWQ
jgi:hypothetical protein